MFEIHSEDPNHGNICAYKSINFSDIVYFVSLLQQKGLIMGADYRIRHTKADGSHNDITIQMLAYLIEKLPKS